MALLPAACVDPFDTERTSQSRALGEEVYGLVCDRVGAQSLRDDITGKSYHEVCHRTDDRPFAAEVERDALPVLRPDAYDAQGAPVSLSQQSQVRERGIARVEALAEDRDPLIEAFTAMLPDVQLPALDTCGKEARLYDALLESLSGMVPLYEDDTVPALTRALGGLLERIAKDEQLAKGLARVAAREGYRPEDLALYVLRPLLSYDRLFDLGAALADVHRENRHGARDKLSLVLDEAARELRELSSEAPEPKEPLLLSDEPLLAMQRISRPRTAREISLDLLSKAAGEVRDDDDSLTWIVKRDDRGLAMIRRSGGVLPFPFVADGQGAAETDALGRFVTQDGKDAPRPFLLRNAVHARPQQANGQLLYEYLPIPGSVFGQISTNFAPLFVPRKDNGSEAMLDALEVMEPLLGRRDSEGAAYDAQRSPLVGFVHALTVTLSRPEMEDALALFEKLSRERPEVVARLVKLLLSVDKIADRYPEVSLRDESTLWDELLDVIAELAHTPGLLEDILKTFKDERTEQLGAVFASYMRYRDEITYYRDQNNPTSRESLNGPVFNLTTGDFSVMQTEVDRSLPDTGQNRSVLQRFLQLLHDANGLTACSKEGAVAHVDIRWNGLPVKLDYPTSPLSDLVCAFLGAPVTKNIPECGILRFDNVSALIIKVALGEYEVEVRDPCLAKLMESPLVPALVGSADEFLNETSGINGFGIHPTVQGVARLAFFDAPYSDWGGFAGDNYYPKTRDFLRDVIDPVPSMVCPVAITEDPVDGSPTALRRCERYEDTLRGRDPNGLFPLEQLGFLEAVQPFARAFDDHDATPIFVSFLDVLHRHWGTAAQTKDECDPTLPTSHARWCSQDGVSRYEPMLADMLTEVNLFGELADIVKLVEETKLPHCDARDAQGTCLSVSERDGLTILAEAVRALVDPARSSGLTDLRGKSRATRNDGSEGGPMTPAQLWLGALSDVRKGFSGEGRKVWLSARSQIIDRLLEVEDRESQPRFTLRALDAALPQALYLLRQQLLAHCPVPGQGSECAWVQASVRDISEAIESPVTARVVDVVNALRADEASRTELGRLTSHLMGLDEEAHASTVAAVMDLLQVIEDDESVRPLAGLFAQALSSENKDERNVLGPRTLDLLARFFAAPSGGECAGVDPHHAFAEVFERAVTPPEKGKRAPIEVLIDTALRVNRKNPRERTVLQPADMQSLGDELAALMLDPASGLEQLYAVLRQISDEKP